MSEIRFEITEAGIAPFRAKLFVDGNQFGDGARLDIEHFRDSAVSSGAFDLLTCSCGAPGCAGIFEPVFVAHRNFRVIWECTNECYPDPRRVQPVTPRTLRYVFERGQYVDAVRTIFEQLRLHPASRVEEDWYCGFNPKIFDEPFPTAREPLASFSAGSTIVVGTMGEYRQPWVWLEGNEELGPRQLLPTRELWLRYERWAFTFGNAMPSFGQCPWKANAGFEVAEGVRPEEALAESAALAREIQSFWGMKVRLEMKGAS